MQNTYPEPDIGFTPSQSNLIPISPNNPPWNGWVASAVWLVSVLLVVIIPSLFLLPYLFSKNLNFADSESLKEFLFADQTAIVLQLAPVILVHGLTLVLAWLVATRMNKFSFRQTLGWEWGGFRIWHAGAILAGFYFLYITLTAAFGDVENDFERMVKSSRTAVYLVAFFATFTAPLVEEVVYRGLLYSAFQRRFGIVLAVIFVTFLFTIIHVPQYSLNGVPDYSTVITLLAISLSLTLIRVRTDNLLPCVALHTFFNGTQSALLILEPYLFDTGAPVDVPASILFFIK